MTAREALIAAWAKQEPAFRPFFGLTAVANLRATTFRWQNFVTNDWGILARVADAELVGVTTALLAELRSLRDGQRKPAQSAQPWRKRKTA